MKSVAREESMHPALVLVLLFLLIGAGTCFGLFLAWVVGAALYGIGGLDGLAVVLGAPMKHPHGWAMLMWVQGLSLLFGFGAGAWALPKLRNLSPADYFQLNRPVSATWLLAAAAVIIISMPAMAGLVAWNAGLHLPPWLYDFEHWARLKEDQAQTMTTFLTRLTSPGRLLVALLVVAVIPAIAEELTFRGVVLRQFRRWTGSVHWAVWLSAIVFSAIHFQFFGFFPRMILGVVLGYLFVWSGNILVPMVGHFAQNAFQLLLLYLQQSGRISFDADANDTLPWPLMLVSAVLTAGLLYWMFLRRQQASPQPMEAHTLTSHGIVVQAATDSAHTLSSRGIDAPAGPPSV